MSELTNFEIEDMGSNPILVVTSEYLRNEIASLWQRMMSKGFWNDINKACTAMRALVFVSSNVQMTDYDAASLRAVMNEFRYRLEHVLGTGLLS